MFLIYILSLSLLVFLFCFPSLLFSCHSFSFLLCISSEPASLPHFACLHFPSVLYFIFLLCIPYLSCHSASLCHGAFLCFPCFLSLHFPHFPSSSFHFNPSLSCHMLSCSLAFPAILSLPTILALLYFPPALSFILLLFIPSICSHPSSLSHIAFLYFPHFPSIDFPHFPSIDFPHNHSSSGSKNASLSCHIVSLSICNLL